MPFTCSCSVFPEGTWTATVEPTRRSWSSAKASSTNAPSAPSVASVCCEPSFHRSVSTWSASGSTAVTNSVLSKMRASPVRVLATASTPGTFATASAASVGIGEKLFCAVIA